jgi:integrase
MQSRCAMVDTVGDTALARQTNRLSARTVQTLTAHGKHHDGGGLYLVVDPKGRRWVLRYQIRKRRREMGLGAYPLVSLARAREIAEEARRAVAEGKDPILVRKVAAGVPTFGEVADRVIAELSPGWRGRSTEASWKRSLEKQAAKLRPLPVSEVTPDDVLEVVKPIWTALPESGGKLRERIERVLDAAAAAGYRAGDNPARWKGNLQHRLPVRKKLTKGHHRALAWAAVPALMQRLSESGSTGALALMWTILTAAREGMTTGATWQEITADLWVVPGERMKEGVEHRVPLAAGALELLGRVRPPEGAYRPTDPIFPGARRNSFMSNATMDAVLRRMGVNATPHGFRSTFRDWAGDCTEHPREVAEAALSHKVGDDVERAYRRGDALEKRRRLMADWARFCLTPPSDGGRPAPGDPPAQ